MTPSHRITFMVGAKTKAEAAASATALAERAGHRVLGAHPTRFPEGRDYNVNWKVVVEVETTQ